MKKAIVRGKENEKDIYKSLIFVCARSKSVTCMISWIRNILHATLSMWWIEFISAAHKESSITLSVFQRSVYSWDSKESDEWQTWVFRNNTTLISVDSLKSKKNLNKYKNYMINLILTRNSKSLLELASEKLKFLCKVK